MYLPAVDWIETQFSGILWKLGCYGKRFVTHASAPYLAAIVEGLLISGATELAE